MLVPPSACNALPTPHIPPDTMACALPSPVRSVGGPHVVCRPSLSCRAESHRPFFSCMQHSTALCSPFLSSLFCSPLPQDGRRRREKGFRTPKPSPTPGPINPRTDERWFREKTHTSFFLICPREPTLNKVIDHFCHFAWGGLGEQNVSLSSPPTGLTASFITVAPRLSRSKSGRCCILQGSSPASVRDACVRAWYGIGGKVP